MATYHEAVQLLSECADRLMEAYAVAAGTEARDAILAAHGVVVDEMNAIIAAGFVASSAQYVALGAAFKQSQQQLQAVRDKIDQYVKAVHIAAQVADVVERVASKLMA